MLLTSPWSVSLSRRSARLATPPSSAFHPLASRLTARPVPHHLSLQPSASASRRTARPLHSKAILARHHIAAFHCAARKSRLKARHNRPRTEVSPRYHRRFVIVGHVHRPGVGLGVAPYGATRQPTARSSSPVAHSRARCRVSCHHLGSRRTARPTALLLIIRPPGPRRAVRRDRFAHGRYHAASCRRFAVHGPRVAPCGATLQVVRSSLPIAHGVLRAAL